jgi:hypothetical protein
MRILFLFMLTIAGSYTVQAQETANNIEPLVHDLLLKQSRHCNKYSLKLYNLSMFNPERVNNDSLFTMSNRLNKIISPAAALNIRTKRGNQHEIELSDIRYEVNEQIIRPKGFPGIYSDKHKTIGAALRYEYILVFAKKKDWKVQPSLGFSGQPYVNVDKVTSGATTIFPTSYSEVGMRGYIIPRINTDIFRRIFLDVNVPVCMMDMKYTSRKKMNPSLSPANQNVSLFDFEAMPSLFSFRIGLGVRL